MYCLGNCAAVDLGHIQRLPKRAARIINNNFDYVNTRGLDLVKSLKWSTFEDRQKYLISLVIFKAIHGEDPDYIKNIITMLIEIVPYNLRNES